MATMVTFTQAKWLGCKAHHSPPTNARIKNVWELHLHSSSSGPGAYAPDAPQPIGLLCNPCHPRDFRHSHFRRQAPPRPYDVRDPSSERWNCGRECWP